MTANAYVIPLTDERPQWTLKLPWLALAPLALIPLLGTNSGILNTLLVATEMLFLAAGVRRPVWVVGALLINEMTAANLMHHFGGFEISNRLLLVLISLPIVAPHIAGPIDIGRKARLTIALGLAFVFLTTFVNSLYAGEAYTVKFLRYIGIGLYFLVLIPIAVRNRDDLRDLGVMLFGIAGIVALASILQHYSSAHGTPVWQVLPQAGTPGDSFAAWEERAIGLSENPIVAGNTLLVFGLIALGALLLTPMSADAKRLAVAGLLMIGAAGYFTYSRSWAIAMLPALLSLAIAYKGAYRREFWLIVIVLAGGFWYWSDMKSTRYTLTAAEDDSAAARPLLWTLSFDIAADHPWLGVGHNAFLQISPEYAKTMDANALEQQGAHGVVGKYTPHDDLLNIWLSWGFFALAIYVGFSLVMGWNFYQTFINTADPLLKGLAIGGLSALIAFQVNSLFHNFLDATLTLWILGGFSLLLLKLDRKRPPRRPHRERRVIPTEPLL